MTRQIVGDHGRLLGIALLLVLDDRAEALQTVCEDVVRLHKEGANSPVRRVVKLIPLERRSP